MKKAKRASVCVWGREEMKKAKGYNVCVYGGEMKKAKRYS